MNEEAGQLIGQLQEAAAAGNAEAFRTAVLALMEAYNRASDESLFSLLHDLLYVPNADAMRANYERARHDTFRSGGETVGSGGISAGISCV